MMDFYDVIKNRKSIRKYESQKVPEDVLMRILDAARWAPSWGNKQCSRYVVVDDPAVISHLAIGMVKTFNAPMLIVICADPDQSGHKDGKDYYLVDAAISFEHLVLAAAAEGLGTCWVGGALNEADVKQQLGIPEKLRVVAMTPLGYPEGGLIKGLMSDALRKMVSADSRKPLSEIVFKNKYGVSYK